ncbi:hypothetical protein DdX_10235 [Ditylenchus destructor]|uniref:Uncharacterized protein n=1 Tax=Ditylenchus destructor TaxID=166010 RepID=A0AAD4MYA9_9BILA|nr:hypothetical protein DdX_10235 [Ditylenchus destructor]
MEDPPSSIPKQHRIIVDIITAAMIELIINPIPILVPMTVMIVVNKRKYCAENSNNCRNTKGDNGDGESEV